MSTHNSTILAVQAAYAATQASGKTPETKRWAAENDKACHKELNALRAKACNKECFDCTALKPGWAVLPHGIFVCIDCAQVHRNLGRHISQTKAINTGTYLWFEHEMAVMRAIGNGVAILAYSSSAQKKPSRDASPAEKMEYARAKYEEHRWGPHYNTSSDAVSIHAPPATSFHRSPATTQVYQEQQTALDAQQKHDLLAEQSNEADLISLNCGVPTISVAQRHESRPHGGTCAGNGDFADFAEFSNFKQVSAEETGMPLREVEADAPEATASAYDLKKRQVLSYYGSTMTPQTFQNKQCGFTSQSQASYDAGVFFAEYGL